MMHEMVMDAALQHEASPHRGMPQQSMLRSPALFLLCLIAGLCKGLVLLSGLGLLVIVSLVPGDPGGTLLLLGVVAPVSILWCLIARSVLALTVDGTANARATLVRLATGTLKAVYVMVCLVVMVAMVVSIVRVSLLAIAVMIPINLAVSALGPRVLLLGDDAPHRP